MRNKYIIAFVGLVVVLGISIYAYKSENSVDLNQGKIDINAVCEGALAYMTFTDGESAEKFVAECKEGKHPDVINQYIELNFPNFDGTVSSGNNSGSFNMIIDDGSPTIIKEGRITCLPHTNTDGPQTMECAFGFKTTDGVYYALDGGDMPDQITTTPTDQDVRIEGRFTPVSELSADYWQRYPIIGIITVTAIENI